VRGQRFLEAILSVQACEREGVKVVLLTEEEDSESGTAPPLLVSVPELKAAVSASTGATLHPFDGVQRSIGGFDTTQESNMGEIPAIHGRYGTSHFNDIFGYDTQSYDSY